MEERFGLFTIGQFAALHGINKKTLMWYDEIGIFKPAVIRKNGYRYYAHFQSSTLEAILMLRNLDVPVKKIQNFLDNRSDENLKTLLKEQTAELEQRLAKMQAMKKTLARQLADIDEWAQADLNDFQITEKEQEHLILLHTSKNIAWEEDVKNLMDEIRRRDLGNLYDATYGALLPVSSLYNKDYSDYRAVFLTAPNLCPGAGIHIKPAGKYLQMYYRGDIDHMSDAYRRLMEYAQLHKIQLSGYAYETVLNELTVTRAEDYLTRIEVGLA